MTIPVMHCFDNNYVIPAAVSFYSMLEHADTSYNYSLYVLHTDITWQNQMKLKELVSEFPNASLDFINMSHRFDDIWSAVPNKGHLAKEVLYKLIVASIFPQYEKMIITDVDVVFLDDISRSYFSFDAADAVYMAGVRHVWPSNSFLADYYQNYVKYFGETALSQLKICGGYLVMNLTKIKEDNMEKVFIDYLKENSHRLLQAEQDVLNFCCPESKIRHLPLNYVVCSYAYDIYTTEARCHTDENYQADEIKDALLRPIQLHYATGIKPWKVPNSSMADKWYLYLQKTNYFHDYLNIQMFGGLDTDFIPLWHHLARKKDKPDASADITVLCCTYNHEKFIREALDGIVRQITEASVEVIISDDASTDGTQDIIRAYQEKYPYLFKKCILRSENVGIGENYYEALKLAEGRYLAICDGDDAWIDAGKLQLQFEFLNDNPEYMICCTSFQKRRIDGEQFSDAVFYVNDYIRASLKLRDSYNFNDLLNCRFIASCTTMLRWRLNGMVPEWLRHFKAIDYTLSLIHSAFGPIHVMNESITARYNVHDAGLTVQSGYNSLLETMNIICEVNQFLGYCLEKQIRVCINKQKMIAPEANASNDGKITAALKRLVRNRYTPRFIFVFCRRLRNAVRCFKSG